jgi:hypothetical protein
VVGRRDNALQSPANVTRGETIITVSPASLPLLELATCQCGMEVSVAFGFS